MLDLHVLYAAGDVDGPLCGEVKIGVSSRKAYPEELKALRTYRSAETTVRFEVVICGRARAKVVETGLREQLRRAGRGNPRGPWWQAATYEFEPIVKLIAASNGVPLIWSQDEITDLEREAFARIETRQFLGDL